MLRGDGDDGRVGETDARRARYEPVAPLPRPWERRAGYDRRPDADPEPEDELAAPPWLPQGVGRRVARARTVARGTRRRTAGGARMVREVAGGVREEAERVALDAEERARGAAQRVADRRGVPTVLVGAALVLVACTWLLVTADPWAPSAGARAFLVWAIAVVGLGLAAARPDASVTATFRAMLLPAAALAVLAPFSRAEAPFAWAFLAVPLMGAGGAVAVGLTAGVARRSLERPPAGGARFGEIRTWGRGAAARHPLLARVGTTVRRPALVRAATAAQDRLPGAALVVPRAAVAATVLAAVLAAWGVRMDGRVVEVTPERPLVVSDRTGSFRGVSLATPLDAVRARLGVPTIVPEGDRAAGRPLDAPAGLALPGDLPEGETWRYAGVALLVRGSRIEAMVVSDARAETAAGVGVGDSLGISRRAYGGLACSGVRRSGATNPAYPACRSRLPGREGLRRVGIVFAGDPVQTVTLRRGERGPLLQDGGR